MCTRKAPQHPNCGHAAHGSALEGAYLERCPESLLKGQVCETVPWGTFNVVRSYCDRCIINGELLSQQRGLDPGIYCQGMGVTYSELRDYNPGALP